MEANLRDGLKLCENYLKLHQIDKTNKTQETRRLNRKLSTSKKELADGPLTKKNMTLETVPKGTRFLPQQCCWSGRQKDCISQGRT